MSRIQFTATFPNIPREQLSEFKRLAAQAIAITRAEDDNLQYDWFFNADETKCVVHEAYASSDAVFAHTENLGELPARIGAVGGVMEVECFGTPSDELRSMLGAMSPDIYTPFQSE